MGETGGVKGSKPAGGEVVVVVVMVVVVGGVVVVRGGMAIRGEVEGVGGL